MQEPVFRTSDGEVVEPRAKDAAAVPVPQRQTAAVNEDASALEALYAPPENIKPANAAPEPEPIVFAEAAPVAKDAAGAIIDQPYVSEEYAVDEIKAAVAAATTPKSSTGGLIFKLLAAAVVLGALAVAVIFLAWFLFMRPAE